jgi:hypothetical protein
MEVQERSAAVPRLRRLILPVASACALLSCFAAPVRAAPSEDALQLQGVLHKVEGYLRSIQYVECRYAEVSHSLPDGLTLERQCEIRADISGREYCSYHDKGATGGSCYAWNGEIKKTYSCGADGRQEGHIDAKPPGGLNFNDPIQGPLDFITNNGGTLKHLYTTPSNLVSVEKTADDTVYAVKFQMFAPTADVPAGCYGTVWFSRKHSFAPVRHTHELNGKLLGETSYELKEIVPGIWLPVRTTGKGYIDVQKFAPGKLVEASPVPASTSTTEVEPGSYKVNIRDTKGKFDLTFPAGVRVADMVTGKTYVTGTGGK